jgi:hypothetical protein
MTRRHKHPSADQLASLAVGALRPRKAARIQAHVAHCEQCTRICKQLTAIRVVLASATYPPIPDDLSDRIGSAINREARQRLAAMPASEAGRRYLPARLPRPDAGGGWHLPGLPIAATRLAAAAGAVVIAAAGGYLVAGDVGTSTRSPSSPLAGAAAPVQHVSLGPSVTYGQPEAVDTIRAIESRTNFVAAHLRTEATSAVHAAEVLGAFAARSPASTAGPLSRRATAPPAGNPSAMRLAGCIGRIAPGRPVLLIDIARYQGKPAAVIVTGASVVSQAEAWVVGSSCSATTADVLARAALGNI